MYSQKLHSGVLNPGLSRYSVGTCSKAKHGLVTPSQKFPVKSPQSTHGVGLEAAGRIGGSAGS